jgi:uncharacterized SAM-binding protein YcdF (DUF218 family)
MIQIAIEGLKALGPASFKFHLVVLAVGVVIAFLPRTKRVARWYFAAVFIGYWIVASPACAERLVAWKGAGYHAISAPEEARGARTVVVLGAGNYSVQSEGRSINQVSWDGALRLLEAARLYDLLDRPTIVVSGGITQREKGARSEADAMRTAIIGLGVAPEHVVVEAESKTTADEARILSQTRALMGSPIVLVTSPTHMSRALAVFRAAGFDAIPSVSPYKSEHALERLRWVPGEAGLLLFQSVVYDGAAGLYYRARHLLSDGSASRR